MLTLMKNKMRYILLIIGLFLGFGLFAQNAEFDVVYVDGELYVRDTTIIELIQEHSSAATLSAGNNLTKVGDVLKLGGTATENTEFTGNGYDWNFGTSLNNVGDHYIYSNNNIYRKATTGYILNVNNIEWTFDGSLWISEFSDTLMTNELVDDKIENAASIIPFNYKYNFLTSTIDDRPGIGNFKLNNVTYSSVSQIYVDFYDVDNVDKSNFISIADTGTLITITDGTSFINYKLNGGIVNGGSYYKLGVDYLNNSGVITGLLTLSFDNSNNTGGAGGIVGDSTFVTVTGTQSVNTPLLLAEDNLTIQSTNGGYLETLGILGISFNTTDYFDVNTGAEFNVLAGESRFDSDVAIQTNAGVDFYVKGDSLGSDVGVSRFKTFIAGIGGFLGNLVGNKATLDTLNLGGVDLVGTTTLKEAGETQSFDSLIIKGYSIRFNESEGVHEFLTAKEGVIWQGALEDLVQVYNSTGVTITNGTPCYFSGSIGDTMATVGIASAALNAIAIIGLATGDIPNNDWGFLCRRGKVRNIPISGLSLAGALFLSVDSTLTNVKPAFPNEVIVIGGVLDATPGDATVLVDISLVLRRQIKSKSYTFTSLSIASGEYWKAGFYNSSATDANLTQASPSITFGTADIAYEAHPFAVYGGAGSVTGGGRVALIATGTSYNDKTGVQTAADVDTIITDITTASVDIYDEAIKYLGTTTYSLVIAEGAPTAYSLDFNYGYAKYDDLNDRDFYISALEAVWTGDGTDATGFDIEIYKHTQTGWTYSAGAFEPGNGVIASRSVDQAGYLRVVNGTESAWKRSLLNEYINGTGEEGYVIKVTTGANSTIQTMDIHVESAIE